jgi:hypothetical protein
VSIGMGAHRERRRWAWTLGAALGLVASFALHGIEMQARAGTQQCNTECQSKMTDCILACDGMRSCEEACKKKGQSCVGICTSDAGALLASGGADAAGDAPLDRDPDARAVNSKDASTRSTPRDR